MKLNSFYKSLFFISAVFLAAPAAHAEAGQGMREMLNDPLAWGFAVAVFFLLIALFALNKALNTVREVTLQQLHKETEGQVAAQPVEEGKSFMQVLTDAKPVEREADILLDHDYDGIHELDNNLPPWWIWGFYISIAYAVIYMIVYITGDALDTHAEYDREMASAKEKVEAYLATSANAVDENSVVLLTDQSAIDAGAKIFGANCAACHLADGGGMVGPNLTDEYWLHGGGIKNVFTTIKYGVPAKGMISWKDQLSPVQMQQVASYVLSLQGTTPANPKAPEGDKWVEETIDQNAAEEPAAEGDVNTEQPATQETTNTEETTTTATAE